MAKLHLNLSVDSELANEGREKMINMSELMESALRDKLNKRQLEIEEGKQCAKCYKPMREATEDDLNGLMYVLPFYEWLCPQCLEQEKRKVPVAQGNKK